MKFRALLLGAFSVFLLASCTPEKIEVFTTVDHEVGAQSMEMDTVLYVNEVGNEFSITRLEYYLSGFVLEKSDGELIPVDGIFYINGAETHTLNLAFGELPTGAYSGMQFNIGILPDYNYLDSLPNTMEHIGMQWPMMMGGGLHFIKMEGHFMDNTGAQSGYAVHLGTNPTLIPIEIDQDFAVGKSDATLELTMDILEWYKNPEDYDLNGQNYTMGDSLLMQKIKANGADVFTLQ